MQARARRAGEGFDPVAPGQFNAAGSRDTRSNRVVLASCIGSHEDEKWGHGAFTKALLDALSASDDVDTNHDGVISMSELTAYIQRHLTELTGGDQQSLGSISVSRAISSLPGCSD